MRGLQDQVVVVAGGGRGIGRAVADKFAEYGARVAIGSRTGAEVEAAAAAIRERGGQAAGYVLDVTDSASVDAFVERVMADFGRIDSLVYCAGINARVPAEDYPEEAWVRVLNTNLTGAYRTCQAVGRRMIQQGGGSIVTITSMMSHVTTPNQSAYAAAKGGLLQYTRVLAVEWAKYNIRVNAVSPGYIRTEMTARALEEPSFRDNILLKTPQGRLGLPEEIAEAVCFLASPAASFITGIALPVDGGFLAGHPQIVPRG
ncbi:SDR family NAD(P)-dependent oxidoreductase [Alicyclobacillus macrosporangiidus]|uniref:SDR family NAD(P)-dependent oxidoreductase n=1 Tax=Alicyclobacillus macrosporangiidus TaxID=392015 RepID=UPI000497D9E1|nr:SDR family oxidoreductase [Alicyclobacillus macrosporangiidus]